MHFDRLPCLAPYGASSREELEAFESALGRPLPSDYKSFLAQQGGVLAERGAFVATLPRPDDQDEFPEFLVELWGITQGSFHSLKSNVAPRKGATDELPDDVCLIGRTSLRYLVLELGSDDSGSISTFNLDELRGYQSLIASDSAEAKRTAFSIVARQVAPTFRGFWNSLAIRGPGAT